MAGLERLHELEDEYAAVEAQLIDPAVLGDPARLRDASRRHKQLTPLITTYRRYLARQAELDAAQELLTDASGDERELVRAEVHSAEEELERLQDELKELLIPADPDDGKNVIVEIRGAE